MGLLALTQQRFSTFLTETLGSDVGSQRYGAELVGAVNRVNYNQGNSLNALVGANLLKAFQSGPISSLQLMLLFTERPATADVALARDLPNVGTASCQALIRGRSSVRAGLVSMLPAVDNRIFRIRGGNARLPERLLEASGAKIKSNWVVDTVKPAKHGRFELHASHHVPPPGNDHHHHDHHHQHKHSHGHHHGHHHGRKRGLAEAGEGEHRDAAERSASAAAGVGGQQRSAAVNVTDQLLSWEQVRSMSASWCHAPIISRSCEVRWQQCNLRLMCLVAPCDLLI